MSDSSLNLPQESLLAIRDSARAHAYEHYLSALLAPREFKQDLITLAAFVGEIERVPLIVSDAALGEIRIRWWLDWLEGLGGQARRVSPVADALSGVIARRDLPVEVFIDLVEARALELYAQPFTDKASFDDFLIKTSGAASVLAGKILGRCEVRDATADALQELGCAFGAVRQLLRLPHLASRGRWGLYRGDAEIEAAALQDPAELERADAVRRRAVVEARLCLEDARGDLKGEVRSTFRAGAGLPAALVEPYLRVLEKQEDWLRSAANISPLSRVWRLWRAQRSGRI